MEFKEYQIAEARISSGVLIHGDCRISGDLTPFISSRTRGGLQRIHRLNSDGLVHIPAPKFSSIGALLWDIDINGVYGYRSSIDSITGQTCVEFFIRWAPGPRTGTGSNQENSWETLDTLLTNPNNHSIMAKFFLRRKLWKEQNSLKTILEAMKEEVGNSKDLFEPRRRCGNNQGRLRCMKALERGIKTGQNQMLKEEKAAKRLEKQRAISRTNQK